MTDTRKVRPVAPLDATPYPRVGKTAKGEPFRSVTIHGLGVEVTRHFTDAEFAAAFMPAELFDAVLTAARAAFAVIDKARDEVSLPPGYVRGEGYGVLQPLYDAVRAYDAHGK